MPTKIARLTGLNVAAVEQALSEGHLTAPTTGTPIKITRTTIEFPWSPHYTLAELNKAKRSMVDQHGSRQHPVASLHAVIRKVARLAEEN